MGLGRFKLEDVVCNQVEKAAPESGSGDPSAKECDWTSPYWRTLGAPGHGARVGPDVARFYAEFLTRRTDAEARHARRGEEPQSQDSLPAAGFAVGSKSVGAGCSEKTFGHTGSSGTLVWADPVTDTVCVVLTTLPAATVTPHPRALASDLVAKAVS